MSDFTVMGEPKAMGTDCPGCGQDNWQTGVDEISSTLWCHYHRCIECGAHNHGELGVFPAADCGDGLHRLVPRAHETERRAEVIRLEHRWCLLGFCRSCRIEKDMRRRSVEIRRNVVRQIENEV